MITNYPTAGALENVGDGAEAGPVSFCRSVRGSAQFKRATSGKYARIGSSGIGLPAVATIGP